MAFMEIRDSAMWIKHLGDAELGGQLSGLAAGSELELEVDGIIGRWQRMKDGSDGRPTLGLRPVGSMGQVWSRWYQSRRGEMVSVRLPMTADRWLQAAASTFHEWNSAEDEAAFGDL